MPRARYAPAGTPGRAHAEACGLRAGRLWGGAHGAGAFHTHRLAGRKGRQALLRPRPGRLGLAGGQSAKRPERAKAWTAVVAEQISAAGRPIHGQSAGASCAGQP